MDVVSMFSADWSDMSLEYLRLRTFDSYKGNLCIDMMAYYGFYLSPTSDEKNQLCCYYCNVEIPCLSTLDDVLKHHKSVSPNCEENKPNIKIQYKFLTNLMINAKFILYSRHMLADKPHVVVLCKDIMIGYIKKSGEFINENKNHKTLYQDILDLVSNRSQYLHTITVPQVGELCYVIENIIKTGKFENTTTIKPRY